MRHEKGTFTGSRIELDGNEFIGCKFISCTFVYAAKGPVTLSGNDISGDLKFEFAGAAADTLQMLQAIWLMGEHGRGVIIKTFRGIAPDLRTLN
jgi:hypothetical protein